MGKRKGLVWMVVFVLCIASTIGIGPNAAAKSEGKYIADLQFSYTSDVVPERYKNKVPDSDNWDLINPDVEEGGDLDMEGDMVFAYAKAYVKRTNDASKTLRDIQIRSEYDDGSRRILKDANQNQLNYWCVLPRNNSHKKIYNMLYTTSEKKAGDPICDVFFLKDSLDCNGAEFAMSRWTSADPIPFTSYSARSYIMGQKEIPVYTVFIRDNVAKRYVSDVMLVKGNDDKARTKVLYKGYRFVKVIELDGEGYTLGINRTDKIDEALRGVYFTKDGRDYRIYTSKSKGAGSPIVDICPKGDMLVKDGENITLGEWTNKYFLGKEFKRFVKKFVDTWDSAYKKNKASTLGCTSGEVKQYEKAEVMKADLGFEKSILSGINVDEGSTVSNTIAVVRRTGETQTGDIVIDGIKGTGTSDPQKLEAYRSQLGTDEAQPAEEVPATGSLLSGGNYLWILVPIAVILIAGVVFVYFRKKKN